MARPSTLRWTWFPILLLLAACFEAAGPELEPTVDGSWIGQSQGLLIALDLEQRNGVVTGTGTVLRGLPIEFTVRNGSHTFPNLSLVGDPGPGYASFRLMGEVTEGRIAATLEGSGFMDFDVHLARW